MSSHVNTTTPHPELRTPSEKIPDKVPMTAAKDTPYIPIGFWCCTDPRPAIPGYTWLSYTDVTVKIDPNIVDIRRYITS